MSPLAPTPKMNRRPAAPTPSRIPELDAANPAPVTGEIDLTSPAALRNSIANLKLVVGAVLKMDDNSLEFDSRASDPKLNLPKHPAIVHGNPVVIRPSVNIRSAKRLPSAVLWPLPV